MARTLRINDTLVPLRPKETVLQAALRSGIDFPNSCRVGGCGTCKCRLAEGEVRELTETGYLLSDEEIDRGTILACQSVPKSDVRIEVDLARQRTGGRVVAQEKLTHDITHLTVELDAPIDYEAGQFADVSFDDLPNVARSYSFATAPRPGGTRTVAFTVRKVPGGALSSFVVENDVRGKRVRVGSASGAFWLRESTAPIVMIAGGSGLPPILAMLEHAAEAGVSRAVTLVFGARTQRDLYALEAIDALARRWKGELRFVPVLSDEPEGSSWEGARGLVTDVLPALVDPAAHAYLCGPPAMIDASLDVLHAHGVARANVHFDRFTTRADGQALPPVAAAPTSSLGQVLHTAKFFLFHLVALFALVSLVAGGWKTTAGLLFVLALYIVGDAVSGDDTSAPALRHPRLLTAQLWLALPLLALVVFASVWSVCATDPLGFGAWVSSWSGYDALAARAASGPGHHVAAWVLTGLMIGMAGTVPAHELTHRTWEPVSMFVGRWLLAFSFDTSFAIEHVYGHHRYVATTEDPATAPRGRNVYFHILASTVKGNASAWKIEARRLARRRLGPWSWRNAFLRGHLMSVVLVALAWAMGGAVAAGYFVACAAWAKALLEIVNYMEHYGMVRSPSTPVQPRHSWNTNRRVSSWTMFNLTRHSHHHAQGEVPYHALRPFPDAPMMISGYLSTLVVAMIPPLWHRVMTPRVLAWDRDYATAEERALAAEANARSGRETFTRLGGPLGAG